jgi:competence protein ComEA
MDRFTAAATAGLACIGLAVASMDGGTHRSKLPAADVPGLSLIKDAAAAPEEKAPSEKRHTARAEAPLDINSASEAELENLPGVGPSRARRIVRGRPWRSKNDLGDLYVLPRGVYDGIQGRIVARHVDTSDLATGGG